MLTGVLHFLEHAPQRPELQVPFEGYALTPLDLAPRPDALARACFADETIDAHLDALAGRQQGDGGWPLSWEPPGDAARAEWRGRWTLDALVVLAAYGRL